MSRILFGLVSAAVAVAVTGCGGSSQKTSYYRLKSIDQFTVGATADTKTGRYAFTYLTNGYPDKLIHYSSAGTDGIWGTADDPSDYYFSCNFSSSPGYTKSIDFMAELREALMPVYATANAALAAIPSTDAARACGLNYSGQSALVEKIYSTGADGVVGTADDVQQATLNWASMAADQSNTSITANGLTTTQSFYYRTSLNNVFRYIVTNGIYRAYEFNADGSLKDIQRWTTIIAPASWVLPLGSDVRTDEVTYTYGARSVERCNRNGAEVAQSLEVDFFTNNLPSTLGRYTAGTDGLACTADDKLDRYENYGLESAS